MQKKETTTNMMVKRRKKKERFVFKLVLSKMTSCS